MNLYLKKVPTFPVVVVYCMCLPHFVTMSLKFAQTVEEEGVGVEGEGMPLQLMRNWED